MVALHYVSCLALLIAYPVVVMHNLVNEEFFDVLLMHFGLVAVLGIVYRIDTRHLPRARRVPASSFLPMAVLMPVSYLLFTPLALFTLDSGSWETRGAPATASSPAPAPAGAAGAQAAS